MEREIEREIKFYTQIVRLINWGLYDDNVHIAKVISKFNAFIMSLYNLKSAPKWEISKGL